MSDGRVLNAHEVREVDTLAFASKTAAAMIIVFEPTANTVHKMTLKDILDGVQDYAYTPVDETDWGASVPTSISEALDTLADRVYTLENPA